MVKRIAHECPEYAEHYLNQRAEYHGAYGHEPVAHERELEERDDVNGDYSEDLTEDDISGFQISDLESAESTGKEQNENKVNEDDQNVSSEIIIQTSGPVSQYGIIHAEPEAGIDRRVYDNAYQRQLKYDYSFQRFKFFHISDTSERCPESPSDKAHRTPDHREMLNISVEVPDAPDRHGFIG